MGRALRRVAKDPDNGRESEDLKPLPHDPDSDEYWFARQMLSLAETGSMFHGRFVEVHVARLLGAVLPRTGISPWDLLVQGNRPIWVEVKATTGEHPTFTLSTAQAKAQRPKEVDRVWVFVHAADRASRDFDYYVASNTEVAAALRSTAKSVAIRVDAAGKNFLKVGHRGLRKAVREAAERNTPKR